MKTNRYAQECRDCGQMVPAGQGELIWVPDPQSDTGKDGCWGVRHVNSATCEQNRSQAKARTAQRAVTVTSEASERAAFVTEAEAATGLPCVERESHCWPGKVLHKSSRYLAVECFRGDPIDPFDTSKARRIGFMVEKRF